MLAPPPALLLAILSILTPHAAAQAERPSAPAPAFRSALEGYQPFADEKPAPWRATNDNVGRIGGWRAYAREAAAGASAVPATPSEAPAAPAAPAASGSRPAAPATDPHGGHKH